MDRITFEDGLYREHLEEASFLYQKRICDLEDPEASSTGSKEVEDRFEAHLDGLLVGGDRALEAGRKACRKGDAGELHAFARVVCRLRRRDLLDEILEWVTSESGEKVQAVADALKHELPQEWQDYLRSLLKKEDEQLQEIVATVIGYRRIPAGRELVQALWRGISPPLIWAAGRLREQSAITVLQRGLAHGDDAISSAAALALLRMGDRQALHYCEEVAAKKGWGALFLALGGGLSSVPVLREIARSAQASPDAVLALGLLGEISAVPVLLELLSSSQLAVSAASALNLLTGADLYHGVFLPDPFREDELFPDELEAYRRHGTIPTRADGTRYGAWAVHPSPDAESWNRWWGCNERRFRSGIRFRSGVPCSLSLILHSLRRDKIPSRYRQLAHEELVIRYDNDFPFEADRFVSDQTRVIDEAAASVVRQAGAGEWFFAGRRIDF